MDGKRYDFCLFVRTVFTEKNTYLQKNICELLLSVIIACFIILFNQKNIDYLIDILQDNIATYKLNKTIRRPIV